MSKNQSHDYPNAAPADKTKMATVKRVAGGSVDEGKDSKPSMPKGELDKHC